MRLKKGDVVYYCKQDGHRYRVGIGIVDEQYFNEVRLEFLTTAENRRINGVPLNEFESETHWKKLPKGWSYDTDLVHMTWDEYPQEMRDLSFKNPDDIKLGLEKGYLVYSKDKFWGNVEAEITKDGYKIVKKYPMWVMHSDSVTIPVSKCYSTWDEAEAEVNANIAEFKRQASLSDYDWSVEQIDKTLNRARVFLHDNQVDQIREYLLSLPNVEDIETRIALDQFQWKYWKNKKWNNVNV